MHTDDALPWTTSRCNRLLRPLSSKLAKLRKELHLPRSSGSEPRHVSSAFAIRGSPRKTTNFTRPAHKPRGFDKATDPDWRPGAKPAAAKKTTYGGRGARRVQALQRNVPGVANVSRPGEIAFTPLIARMSEQMESNPLVQMSPLKNYEQNHEPLLVSAALFAMPLHLHPDTRKLIQAILETYTKLLPPTTTGDEKTWKGTRSLMGVCLRKLPAYMELEEHFANTDRLEEETEIEDRDTKNEIYQYLEAQFEHRAGQGWRPLKQVVRAHATWLVCEAIEDGILELDSISILVSHCVKVSAWDEAERLLVAYIPKMKAVSTPTCINADLFDVRLQPFLSLFREFVERTGRYRLLYDLLEYMVAMEFLPLEWLATQCMRPLWDRLVRTISEKDHRTLESALQFMETVMIASMGLSDARLLEDGSTGSSSRKSVPLSKEEMRSALNTTFSSLLTVLSSIALASNNREDSVGKLIVERISWILDATVIALSTRDDLHDELKLLGADTRDIQVFAQRALWLAFASLLVHLERGCHSSSSSRVALNTASLGNIIHRTAAQFDIEGINLANIFAGLPSFIISVARGTGRIWQDDGFDQIQRIVVALMAISGFRPSHKLWTLKRLALESAMEFAYGTGDVEHMVFARSIEQTMRTQGRLVIMNSPDKDAPTTASGGFKWEEGIGEWVACTPFIKQNAKRQPQRPLRALALLPSPVPSEDDESDMTNDPSRKTSVRETTAFDSDCNSDSEDPIPPSSPIKKTFSSLGKRTRASSPIILIHAKRPQMTPPDTPGVGHLTDSPNSLQEQQHQPQQNNHLPRRSRRSKEHLEALTSRLQTIRSRSSRSSRQSGLRDIRRATYAELDVDEWIDNEEDSDGTACVDSSSSYARKNLKPGPLSNVKPLSRRAKRSGRASSQQRGVHTRSSSSLTDDSQDDDNQSDIANDENRINAAPPFAPDQRGKLAEILVPRSTESLQNILAASPQRRKQWRRAARNSCHGGSTETLSAVAAIAVRGADSEDELGFW